MIDLGKYVDISRIKIWNRIHCCTENLSGATVSLLDEKSNVVKQVLNIGSTQNIRTIELLQQDFTVTTLPGMWLRVTKEGNVLTAYFKGASSLFWVPFGNQLSLPSISSNGYYIGIALTAHDNSNPNMASSQVSKIDLFRACTDESTTPEQCDQATNCELGLRSETCYDAGFIKTRRVKVHLPKTEYLHLAEIQVLDEYGDNVALDKPATMSSVYDSYISHMPVMEWMA